MKPLFSRRRIISSLALGATVALLPLAQAQTAPVKSVAVTAIVDHPALDAVRKGVEDELKAQGWQAGKNLKYQYQSAQGNAATAGQIVRKFIGDKADAIVAIATPSAQAAAAATSSVPIVFSAVTDPVAAKLVKDLKAPGGNVTGVSDRLPLAPQVDLMLKVVPTAKRVGIVYSPGEINSTILIKELKAVLAQRGMTLVSAAAPRTVDVQAATKSLVGKVDLIYSSTDNNVVSAYGNHGARSYRCQAAHDCRRHQLYQTRRSGCFGHELLRHGPPNRKNGCAHTQRRKARQHCSRRRPHHHA